MCAAFMTPYTVVSQRFHIPKQKPATNISQEDLLIPVMN